MAKFRKKPIVIEAVQWFKAGDHEAVVQASKTLDGMIFLHSQTWKDYSAGCMQTFAILTREGMHEVISGDWIITGVKGEHYPCKPDIFDLMYEAVMPS